MIAQGVADAENAVKAGEGATFEDLVHYHYLKTTGDQRLQAMTYGEFVQAKYETEEFEEFNF